MEMAGQKVAVAHRHFDALVAEDGLQSREIGGRLKKDTGKPMAQIVAPVMKANPIGEPPEMAGKLRKSFSIRMPEDKGGRWVSGRADQSVIGCLAQRDDPRRGCLRFDQANFSPVERDLAPFEGGDLFQSHPSFRQETDHPSHGRRGNNDQTLDLGV